MKIPLLGIIRGGRNYGYRDSTTARTTASADSVWKAIIAIEDYPKYQRAVRSSKVLQRDSSHRPLEAQLEIDALIRPVELIVRYDYAKAPYSISWQYVEGADLRKADGMYRLSEIESTGETEIHLSLHVVPAVPVPRHIRRVLEQTGIRQTLKDLIRHAEAIEAEKTQL